MGLSLAQIAEIVSEPNHDEHKVLLREHRKRIVAQIHRLAAAKRLLDHAIGCPHDDRQPLRGVPGRRARSSAAYSVSPVRNA